MRKMAAVMKADQTLVRSSLERLKTLDALQDFSSQLAEANHLCTHGTRAEMVAKWLLEKLRSTPEVRENLESWRLLECTLRLLPPDRSATLLTTLKFFSTLTSALEDTRVSGILLEPISSLIDLLLDLSQAPNGTSLKSVLSLPASRAASLLGVSLQNAYQKLTKTAEKIQAKDIYSQLRSTVQIWNQRKPAANDCELFAEHCLVWASALLSSFSSDEEDTSARRKRKSSSGDANQDGPAALQTLIAKHIFVPARSAFHNVQDEERKDSRRNGAFNPSVTIEARITFLKETIRTGDEATEWLLPVLPLLLDIALRCISMPTPRHRMKEKAWVEALFEALFQCNTTSEGELISCGVLVKMLKVFGDRASLSRESLQRLLRFHAVLKDLGSEIDLDLYSFGDCTREDWELIAQVIRLDDSIFTDHALAERLFTFITGANRIFHDGPKQESEVYLQCLWVDEIIVPILKAFGRDRNLPAFLNLWSEQMERNSDKVWSVWIELDDVFGPNLETFSNESEILENFDRFSTPITHASKVEVPKTWSVGKPFNSNICILNALLQGSTSESLVEKIRPKCHALLESLLDMLETRADKPDTQASIIATGRPRIWALMTKLFELSFQAYGMDVFRPDSVADYCRSIMPRSAFRLALLNAKRAWEISEDCDADLLREAGDAECFVACVCTRFASHSEALDSPARNRLLAQIKMLLAHLTFQQCPAILNYPALLVFVQDSQTIFDFILQRIQIASRWGMVVDATLSLLVQTATENMQLGIIDEVVRAGIHAICNQHEWARDEDMEDMQSVTIDMFLQIPCFALTRAQRENIINLACRREYFTGDEGDLLLPRLVLLVKLMEAPNATSRLSTNHDVIWELCLGISLHQYLNEEAETPTSNNSVQVMKMSATLTKQILHHLLSNQNQDRSVSVIIDLSGDVKDILDLAHEDGLFEHHAIAMNLVKIIVQEFETGLRDDIKQQLKYRNRQTLGNTCQRLSDTATGMIERIINEQYDDLTSTTIHQLTVIMDTVHIIIDSLKQLGDHEVWTKGCKNVKRILSLLDNSMADHKRSLHDMLLASKASILRCFQFACMHYSPDADRTLLGIGMMLLSTELPPVETEMLLDAFKHHIQRIDDISRMIYIDELLKYNVVAKWSSLTLLQICLAGLVKSHGRSIDTDGSALILPGLLQVVVKGHDLAASQTATDCIILILKTKPFLNNQSTVERTVSTLPQFLENPQSYSIAFLDTCQIMTALLLHHRARLQGRFHLINTVYQRLISGLFQHQSKLTHRLGKGPGPEHARALSRALTLFCEPLLYRRQADSAGLTDESRKEQAHVGGYIQYVLHHYCSEILNKTVGEGIKEALMPGLWSMIEAIEINNIEGMKSLSASMNNSERAILRGMYDEWKTFGKWKGE